jgi:carbonic anhydrase
VEQAHNVCRTTIVRDAWARGQELAVHGWIYGLKDGLIRDLQCTATCAESAHSAYESALAAL